MEQLKYKNEIEAYYNIFLNKASDKLTDFFNAGIIQDEFKAQVLSSMLDGAMRNAITSCKLEKEIEVLLSQNETEKAKTQYQKQLILAEQLKNGELYYEYTYNKDGSIKSKILKEGRGKSIYEIQKALLKAQTDNYSAHLKKEVLKILGNVESSYAVASNTVPLGSAKARAKLAEDITGIRDLFNEITYGVSTEG